MMQNAPDISRFMRALDITWPAREFVRQGPWQLRRGAGGGNRVSAATSMARWNEDDIDTAISTMASWGQTPLFQLIEADSELDAALDARGFRLHEPVVFYAARTDRLMGDGEHIAAAYRATFALAILQEIWVAGGIGPERIAIMDRVQTSNSHLMSRVGDRPCAGAFVAIASDLAMIHAIEVLERFRRKGAARLLIEAAARFAHEQGAPWLALAVTEKNAAARALYENVGMNVLGAYHYRIAPEGSSHE